MKKFIFGNGKAQERDGAIWNAASGMLNAFQSVLILIVISHTLSVEDSGVFTIAWAVANLMVTIGKYGVRNYQVTDLHEQYSFTDYLYHRALSLLTMVLISAGYVCYLHWSNHYTPEKTAVILLMCYLKLVEAAEDVFHGMFQQHERLDVAGKCMTIRLLLSTVIFCIAIVVMENLLIASVICAVVTTVLFVYLTAVAMTGFTWSCQNIRWGKIWGITKACVYIFLGSFLSLYILNAPKYAIDATLGADIQAYYGYISMPVFVVGLLNNFFYMPILTKMTDAYENDIPRFVKLFLQQIAVIVVLTLLSIGGAYLLGIPVLSILYNCNLSAYRGDLCIMMVGGGSLAMVGFLTTVLTLIRKQRLIVIGYGLGGITALSVSRIIVKSYGMTGAAVLYLVLTTVMWIIFLAGFLVCLHQRKQEVRA